MKYSSPPCEHGVGHEPWQVLLLLVEHELEVVAGVALVQRQRHRLELLQEVVQKVQKNNNLFFKSM